MLCGWVVQLGQEIRWEEGQVGLVWFGRNCEAEFRTMNDLMNELPG